MECWIKTVKTRKQHRCWGCGETYPSGSEMTYSSSVDGDCWMHAYWCRICRALMVSLDYWETEDGFGPKELKAMYPEEWEKFKNKFK